MLTLDKYLEAVNYMITEGSKFEWTCFGKHARYVDYIVNNISISAVYDTITREVYMLHLWTNKEYRWINPLYVEAFHKENNKRGLNPDESYDGNIFKDISLFNILTRITKITGGKNYLATKAVNIEFEDKELLELMKYAHERDITFNQLVAQTLQQVLSAK